MSALRVAGLALVLALVASGAAPAQILGGAPGVRLGPALPGLPDLRAPVGELTGLPRTVEGVARDGLADLRHTTAQHLIRAHRDVIDVDDQGEPVVRGEVTVLAPTPDTLAAARKAGFGVREETALPDLDLKIVTLRAPPGLSTREAVRRLRRLDPDGHYDFDHIYLPSGAVSGDVAGAPAAGGPGQGLRIGMVDGGVAAHASLAGVPVEQRGFGPGGVKPTAHATAIASLLAGRDGAFQGAAPGARLLAADVYGTSPTGGSALMIAQALAWLAQARTPVICISLVGPPDGVIKAAVEALVGRGVLLVAAVGNDGPAAPALYPAGYPRVVAVTAVDARRHVLPEAGRGTHVDFAAPGADMAGAALGGGYAILRGTSFAAPLVAGRLALLSGPLPDRAGAAKALAALGAEATDLGAPGLDPVYGRGLVAFDLRTPPAAVRAAHARAPGP